MARERCVRWYCSYFADLSAATISSIGMCMRQFQVIRHVRPKYACKACDTITQAPAPAPPTPRGRATPAMLAHLLVSKYCDHLPLYRQSEIDAREGMELDRSTLCDWVGQASWLLQPIVEGSGATSLPPRRSMATTRRSRCCRLG
jgi:transposase